MVTPDQISTFFNIYRHKSVVLTQFHLISGSTKLHWPSTTKYQPVPPHTDPVPPSTNQFRLLLTQNYHIWTSTAPHWPNTTKYQTVPPSTQYIKYHIPLSDFPLSTWDEHSCMLVKFEFVLGGVRLTDLTITKLFLLCPVFLRFVHI